MKRAFLIIWALSFAGSIEAFATTPKAQPEEVLFSLEARLWNSEARDYVQLEKDMIYQLQLAPKDAFVHYLLSRYYLKLSTLTRSKSQYLQATSLAQQAIELEPKQEFGYVAMAEALAVIGEIGKAKILLSTFKEKNQISFRTDFTLARLNAEVPEQFFADILTLLEKNPEATAIVLPFAVSVASEEFSPEMRKAALLELDQKFPKSLLIQKALLAHFMAKQDFQAADQLLKQMPGSIAQDPELAIYHAYLLSEYHSKHKQAGLEFAKITKIATLPNNLKSNALIYLGSTELRLHKDQDALKHFIEGLRLSDLAESQITYVVSCYLKMAKHQEIVDLIDRLTEKSAAVPALLALQAEILATNLDQKQAALRTYKQASILDPENASYLNSVGVLQYQLGAMKDALKSFEGALLLEPQSFSARYNKACVLQTLGYDREAAGELKEALKFGSQDQWEGAEEALLPPPTNNETFRTLMSN